MKFFKNNGKMFFDMCLSICAAAVPLIVLQLVVYPYLAKQMSSDDYGLMITFYSMWIVISNSLGNVLNNIRLLKNNEYIENSLNGDFPVLLRNWGFINIIVIIIGSLFYLKSFQGLDILLSIVISSLIMLKAYFEVGFRIQLNYVSILVNGVLQGIGFIIGVLFFRATSIWQFVFLCGFLFSCGFTIIRSGLLKEPLKKTHVYKRTKHNVNLYIVATFSANLMGYADKMILYPLMGGHVVSVYYTATILGKIVSMVSGPITSVILSYISKWSQEKKKIFPQILFTGCILSVIGYMLTMVISRPIIQVLFPQWVNEVMVYLPITTIALVIQTLNSFLNPFILKFYDIKWQTVISIVSTVVYFSGSLLLWNQLGMIGFCIGTVIGQLSKTLIMLFINFNRK